MKIQLALDRLTHYECFQVLHETIDYIDIIEVGTGVIKEFGMSIIKEIKSAYPNKTLVADMKTCDAGAAESAQAFEAGANITTVMGFSFNQTILDSLELASLYDKKVMVDLLGITKPDRIVELKDLGVHLISLHVGKDIQQKEEQHHFNFQLIKNEPQFEIAVAGGINLQSLPKIALHYPKVIIVGSAITKANDKRKAASMMKGWIANFENDS